MDQDKGLGPPAPRASSNGKFLGWSLSSRAILISLVLIGSLGLWWFRESSERGRPLDVELVVDPNTAPPEVLLALPRLGPTLVGRIVDQREISPFLTIEDVDHRVKGIGPATIKSIRPYLKIEPRELAHSDIHRPLGSRE